MMRARPDTELPSATQLAWPVLQVLDRLGGSGTNQEVLDSVVAMLGLSEEQQSVLRADGLTTELYHRLALARTYLKAEGAVEQSRRGVWSITEGGRQMTEAATQGIAGRYLTGLRERRAGAPSPPVTAGGDSGDIEPGAEDGEVWKERLLRVLADMTPAAFERLALRLMREAGFVETIVTGRSGDEGIDGSGVYRLSLIGFPVYFQCKRYAGSVGPDKVRDFRGAMEGRGDKGLLITTGTFTSGAKQEAGRAGAKPIDLIDGDRLCDLLKEYGIGVSSRQVENVDVDESFLREV